MTFSSERVRAGSFPRRNGRVLPVHARRGRRRVQPGLPPRPARRRGHADLTDGARNGRASSDAGDRMAYGSTRRNGRDRDLYVIDPKPAGERPPAAGGRRRRLVGARLVSGRSPDPGARVPVGERERPLARGRGQRREEPGHAAGRREGVVLVRRVRQGWPGTLRRDRPGRRVPPHRPPRAGDRHAYVPDERDPVGRRGGRPLARREDARIRDQPGRCQRAAPAGHRHAARAERARLAARRDRHDRMARQQPGPRDRALGSPRALRRLFAGRAERQARALDGERDGRARRRRLQRARAGSLGASTTGPSRRCSTSPPRASRDGGRS